jgi:hypothetical protein
VIQRQGDGFPLDQSRVAYLRYLRRQHISLPAPPATSRVTKRGIADLTSHNLLGRTVAASGSRGKSSRWSRG